MEFIENVSLNNSEQLIYILEKELLDPATRKNAARIGELISEDFKEICSSGQLYFYQNGDTFFEEDVTYRIEAFETLRISKDSILCTYRLNKIDHKKGKSINSLRSSIWKYTKESWQMIFHQGTLEK